MGCVRVCLHCPTLLLQFILDLTDKHRNVERVRLYYTLWGEKETLPLKLCTDNGVFLVKSIWVLNLKIEIKVIIKDRYMNVALVRLVCSLVMFVLDHQGQVMVPFTIIMTWYHYQFMGYFMVDVVDIIHSPPWLDQIFSLWCCMKRQNISFKYFILIISLAFLFRREVTCWVPPVSRLLMRDFIKFITVKDVFYVWYGPRFSSLYFCECFVFFVFSPLFLLQLLRNQGSEFTINVFSYNLCGCCSCL